MIIRTNRSRASRKYSRASRKYSRASRKYSRASRKRSVVSRKRSMSRNRKTRVQRGGALHPNDLTAINQAILNLTSGTYESDENSYDYDDFNRELDKIRTFTKNGGKYHTDIDALTYLRTQLNFTPADDSTGKKKLAIDSYRSYLQGLINRQQIQTPPPSPKFSVEQLASALYKDGAGDLPPGWDYDKTEEGEYYFIKPDETTTWDDPRENFEKYVAEYVAAAKRGVNLEKYAQTV